MSSNSNDRRILSELREEREELRLRIKAEYDNRLRILKQLDREAQLSTADQDGGGGGGTTERTSSHCPRMGLIWPSCEDRSTFASNQARVDKTLEGDQSWITITGAASSSSSRSHSGAETSV